MEKTNRWKGREEAGERQSIELVFKRLKSFFHYNEIPSKLEAAARAQVLRQAVAGGNL
jgi:hypothetical protein